MIFINYVINTTNTSPKNIQGFCVLKTNALLNSIGDDEKVEQTWKPQSSSLK